MRLIDADAINFRCAYNGVCSANEESCKKCSDYVCDFEDIQNQPTAYDVEAVVAELEKLKESVFGCDDTKCSKCKYKSQCFNVDKGHKVALDRAISIVRGKE